MIIEGMCCARGTGVAAGVANEGLGRLRLTRPSQFEVWSGLRSTLPHAPVFESGWVITLRL